MKFFSNNNYVSDNLIIISFLLLPFFLISGSFFPDLVISLNAIFFLIYCFNNRDFRYFKNYYFLLFFIIYIYININSFFSFDPKISFQTSITYVRMIFFSLCFAVILNKKHFIKLFFFFFFIFFI